MTKILNVNVKLYNDVWIFFQSEKITYERLENNSLYVHKILSSLSMYHMRDYNVGDDFWGKNSVDGSIKRLKVSVSKFANKTFEPLMRFHISSKKKSMFIDIVNFTDRLVLNSVIFDNKSNSSIIYTWKIEKGSNNIILHQVSVIGSKEYADEKLYGMTNDQDMIFIGCINDIGDTLEAMRLIRADPDASVKSMTSVGFKRSSIEWGIFSKAIRKIFSIGSTALFEVGGVSNSGITTLNVFGSDEECNLLNDVVEYINDNRTDAPTILCSRKEWNYIVKYGGDRGLFLPDDRPVHLSSALKNPRFGWSFKMDAKSFAENPEDVKNIEVFMSYTYDEEEDSAKFVIDISDSVIDYIINIDCDNMDEFCVESCITRLWSMMTFEATKYNTTPNGLSDMSKRIPINESVGIRYLEMFLSFLLITHDRPERMKSVREESRENTEERKNTDRTKQEPVKPTYVVRHILMPAASAKKYVSKMSSDKSRTYTVESWKRSGHWRTYKSGKTVWISESECTRHLEITKRKEYIKL